MKPRTRWTTAYDDAGRTTSQTDRIGRRRDFGYDAAGRKITEAWFAVGGAPEQTQTWTYDALGRVLTAADPDGTYTLSYDAAGRVTAVQQPFGLSLTFGYDAAGNRTGITDSLGGVTTVVFDALNRQVSERLAGSGVSATRFDYAYTDRGERASVVRFADTAGAVVVGTTTYDFDADGRLTHLLHDQVGAAGGEYTYAYDAANRLTAKVEDSVETTYAYDLTSQLTADGTTTFGYDLKVMHGHHGLHCE